MSRQEDITMSMARALHKRLGIDVETLIQEPLASRERRDSSLVRHSSCLPGWP